MASLPPARSSTMERGSPMAPRVQQRMREPQNRIAPVVLRHRDHAPGARRGGANASAPAHGDGQRLFNEHVEPGIQRLSRRDVVRARGGDDVRRLELGPLRLGLGNAGASRGPVAEKLFNLAGDELGPLAVYVHHRGKLDEAGTHPRQLDKAPQMTPPHAATADQRELVSHAIPSCCRGADDT